MKVLVSLAVIFFSVAAQAEERILSYDSDILVLSDGTIEVTETIRVLAEGRQIRRGIFRDYPIRFENAAGDDVMVVYEPRSVLRDGVPEEFFSEPRGDSVRTYFGSASRLLDPGQYEYVYRYTAGRMLGFFDDYDELYWNVTGHDWAFPIDSVTATVRFDFEMPVESLSHSAYVGRLRAQGSASDYNASIEAGSRVLFRSTRALAVNEGMTIAVGWPKDLVTAPTRLQELTWLLSDNLNLLVAVAGLLALWSYYIPVWQHYGRDPAPGVIVPLYEPPAAHSPASLRYVAKMGYDNATMTAAVVSLAVKGYLRIDALGKSHTLHRQMPPDGAAELAVGERELHDALFAGGDVLELVDENYKRVGRARRIHELSLAGDYKKRYFKTNGLLNLPPIIVAVVAALIAISIGPSTRVIASIVLMVATIIAFAVFMKQPTVPGRRLLDKASGFREYLEIAEKDELNLRNPPDKTPELFESYLPFALALGVEQQWAERFARIFAGLKGPNNNEWQPGWYNGRWNNLNLSSNTSGLASGLSSAISSSVSPPGSSSGSSGGGFAGGGGGGGGGGGW